MSGTGVTMRDGRWTRGLMAACVAASVAAASVLGGRAARAQTTWSARTGNTPVRVTIPLHASAPQPPDLQYQLLPRAGDLHPGNAALGYATAIGLIPVDRPAAESDDLDSLRSVDLASFDEKKAETLLAPYAAALRQLRFAARYDTIDWQTGFLSQGADTPLPNLAPLRLLSNVLAVGIRLDLKRGDFAAAHDKLQTGYALARHLGRGDTLIQDLVGVAIASLMSHEVEEWIGIQGSPNLFWPLAYMPRPLVDSARALSMEKDDAYVSMPGLREMREGKTTVESWTRFTNRFEDLQAGGYAAGTSTRPAYKQQMTATGFALLLYPSAKQWLIEHQHMTAQQVDQMPVAEVLGRYFPESFDASMDHTFRYMNLPPSVSLPALRKAEREFGQPGGAYTNLLARIVLPSLSRALYLSINANRTLDALQTVEGVRAYLAQHQALPPDLAAVELPLPDDPTTGKPFDYQARGGAATITSAPLDDPQPGDTLVYELTTGK